MNSISVIICTRNRASHLRETLKSLGTVSVPSSWTVDAFVVDNGSTDDTSAVVQAAGLQNIKLRYLSEPTIGLSHARNAGIKISTGAAILFTDDDLRFAPDWLQLMCGPILCGDADAVQGSVKIAPHLERSWLKGSLRVWVAGVDDPLRAPEGLVGANMAFSRETALAVGGFDPRLGAGAAGYFDDTVFGWAVARAGRKILYVPTAVVEHHFAPDRLALKTYVMAAMRMATSYAIVLRDLEPNRPLPTLLEAAVQLPGFGVRCVTQFLWFLVDRRPDAGFVVRYYHLRLWFALRMLER